MAESLISIVIPVHNKAALTRQCLDSIFEARPDAPFEVLVVDDASHDSTPSMLEAYGEDVTTVALERNSGFATACNSGAEAARGDWLLFLNNDTIAQPGWLDALAEYALRTPAASVIGSKLLFPDGTIQHAGVAFSFSGDPMHIYAGCAADHPAVNRSRRFQAVTAACLMVHRDDFFEVEGFDTGYFNDLEDVDLCLRLGQQGHEVHYCHESVLYHLESASRGYTDTPSASAKVYRQKWGNRVKSDEFDYYLEDGLLDFLRFSPELVQLDRGRRKKEAEMLQIRSRQFLHLLRETVRLATYAEEGIEANGREGARLRARRPRRYGRGRKRIESRLSALREELGEALSGRDGAAEVKQAATTDEAAEKPIRYADVRADLPALVGETVPEGATVLVVSKGDESLLALPGRRGWHFPRASDGRYAGYYPKTSEDAIAHLEALREAGAEFLAIPATYLWWMDHYTGLAHHLEARYETQMRTETGVVFDLRDGGAPAGPAPRSSDVTSETNDSGLAPGTYSDLVANVRATIDSELPADSTVLVVSRGDDELLKLNGRRGWHFPRDAEGRYLGYHPATDDEAIGHLEDLRVKGGEYLVFPSAAFWWLEHYAGFAEHLRARYATVAYEPDVCMVFELTERFLSDVVRALVPDQARVAVVSHYAGDIAGLDARFTRVLELSDAEEEAVACLAALAAEGVEFVAIPHAAFGWLDERPAVTRYLRSAHRFVTRQEQACELYELSHEAPPASQGVAKLQPTLAEAEDKKDEARGDRERGAGGWLRRLFGGR